MLGGIGVRQVDGLVDVGNQYKHAVFEGLLRNLLTGKCLQLLVELFLHLIDELVGGGNQEYLGVDAVFCLR